MLIDGESLYETCEDYMREFQRLRIFVPKGFLYDGGSVPRALWTATGLTPMGDGAAAWLVHDVMYRFRGYPPAGWMRRTCVYGVRLDREQADQLMRDMLIASNVPKFRAEIAYRGVRWFGGGSWRSEHEAARNRAKWEG